ncbi:MAG TPA: hypothetical protein VNY05_13510 [Candidatus Acidoferrales bacterium]|jgi:hypothetical protein|nr:hypothetical protein [Candidatus Acidoferrales bacterium]
MFELKPISHDSVAGALARVERYRLLNDPSAAESICHDILQIEPGNQAALIDLILALTDQIPHDTRAFTDAMATVPHLDSPYGRAYYAGIVWERRAKARYQTGGPGAHRYVYEWIVTALQLFETAEPLRPQGNDDALLRWNACVRFLNHHRELAPAAEDVAEPIVSE